jgi:hypothetical protein
MLDISGNALGEDGNHCIAQAVENSGTMQNLQKLVVDAGYGRATVACDATCPIQSWYAVFCMVDHCIRRQQ